MTGAPGLEQLADGLASGTLRSLELVSRALSRAEGPEGQDGRVILRTYTGPAMAQAALIDRARDQGLELPRHAGIPLTIKDLFDVAGETTRAASTVLDDQPPAAADAAVVQLLRRAGFVILGKTNMTEFAYSGLGINARFGTPRNPRDMAVARIPGGSSSGAAVSVAAGIVGAAIGSDTGGSCRIPAAFCGITGFKPSFGRVPTRGMVPLARSLDCIGPLGGSVSCCAVLDSVLSGEPGQDVAPLPAGGLRLGVLEGYTTEHLDTAVGAAFDALLSRLSQAGVRLTRLEIPELADLPRINAKGGIVAAEAHAWHAPLLEKRAEYYDPWVLDRFAAGRSQSAADYIEVLDHRARLQALVARRQLPFDALILPTVQIVAPTLASLADPVSATAINLLCLRNTAIANFLDLPAISIPCQPPGSLPVGAMLMGATGCDRHLLSLARGLEGIINAD